MSRVFQFGLAVLLVTSMVTSANAAIILIDPATHDGSFESRYTGSNVTTQSVVTTADWTVSGASGKGILGRPNPGTPSNAFDQIAASHQTVPGGGISLFANAEGTARSLDVSFADLLGTNGYNVLTAGDQITYSVDINALSTTGQTPGQVGSNVDLWLDFGNGQVGLANLVADLVDGRTGTTTPFSPGNHQTLTATYTVTPADVAGGQLQVLARLSTLSTSTNAYIDNFRVSVQQVPEPSTFALVGLAAAGLLFTRRRK